MLAARIAAAAIITSRYWRVICYLSPFTSSYYCHCHCLHNRDDALALGSVPDVPDAASDSLNAGLPVLKLSSFPANMRKQAAGVPPTVIRAWRSGIHRQVAM
jgi:hypothetical protein